MALLHNSGKLADRGGPAAKLSGPGRFWPGKRRDSDNGPARGLQLVHGLMPSLPGHVRLDDLLGVCDSGGQVNRELLKEMLVLFIEENERRVRAAASAAAEGDLSALRGVMHAVKGSAALIGAEHLRDLAGDGELRIISGTLKSPQECARQLSDEYTAVVATLRLLYPDLCPR